MRPARASEGETRGAYRPGDRPNHAGDEDDSDVRNEMTDAGPRSIGRGVIGLFVLALGLPTATTASAQDRSRRFEEIGRFGAAEARQGVAVDERHFYAISNRRIGKYDK